MKIMTTMLLGIGLSLSEFSAAQAETPFQLALANPNPAPTQMTPWTDGSNAPVRLARNKCYPGGGCCYNTSKGKCCQRKSPDAITCPK